MIKWQLFSYSYQSLEINSRLFFSNYILLSSKKGRGLGENITVQVNSAFTENSFSNIIVSLSSIDYFPSFFFYSLVEEK